MITDKSRYGHDAVLDLNCGDSVQVLRTEPMTLTEQEQKIVQKYLGIALLEKSYIDANGHLMVVLSDGRTLDVGSARGLSGATPYLGENGNWFVEGVDTLQSARGLPGFTPYIGENEHWWIDGKDTGIPARGIPLTEKADNSRFLRNDGTWQKVTPENIGAAKQSDFVAQTARIEALEQRTVTAPYYTDDSVAYIKEVPENALPFASVDKIGGITRKCSNLIDLPDKTTAAASFVYKSFKIDSLPVGTYTLSCDHNIPSNVGWWVGLYDKSKTAVGTTGTLNSSTNKATITTTGRAEYVNIYVDSAVTLSKIMLNVGDTALPYEPYFDGLRSAPVTEVESVGVNLWSGEISTKSEPAVYTFDNGTMTLLRNYGAIQAFVWSKVKYKAGVYNISFNLSGMGNGCNFRILKAKTPSATNIGVDIRTLYSNGAYNITFTLTEDGYIGFGTDVDNVKLTASNITLNKGTTALTYTPYRRNTLPVPAEVQALDGYGWGVNADCYNYIDWEKKLFVKRVGRTVFKGDENWILETTPAYGSGFFKTVNANFGAIYTGKNKISSHYKQNDSSWVSLQHNEFDIVDTMIGLRDTRFSTADEFKAHLAEQYANGTPFTVCYELAEPVITDISDLLPDDNLIRVGGGGTVTMVNEYGYDVPSEITYARLTWQ